MNKRLKPHLYKRDGKWTYEKAAPDTAWSELVRIACGSGWSVNQKAGI